MAKKRIINFHKGDLKFSSGHFTIFSETERESLHGHNYYLEASIVTEMEEPGITFDYRIFKNCLKNLCDQLNSKFLLPLYSPYLNVGDDGEYIITKFNHKLMPFLKEDALLLPVSNVTLEELSDWFVAQVSLDPIVKEHPISQIDIRVFNGLEQSSESSWCGSRIDSCCHTE